MISGSIHFLADMVGAAPGSSEDVVFPFDRHIPPKRSLEHLKFLPTKPGASPGRAADRAVILDQDKTVRTALHFRQITGVGAQFHEAADLVAQR